jgi:hypothetical protein
MGISVEFNPDLALRNISELKNAGKRKNAFLKSWKRAKSMNF